VDQLGQAQRLHPAVAQGREPWLHLAVTQPAFDHTLRERDQPN